MTKSVPLYWVVIAGLLMWIFGFEVGKVVGQSARSELHAAVQDIDTLPPGFHPAQQYLSMYSIAPEDRDECFRIVSWACNAVSRTRVIAVPKRVSDTLIRFNILWYASDGQDFKDWCSLLDSMGQQDPYWHIRTTILTGNGKKQSTTETTVDGGWVDLNEAATLRARTGRYAPIMRADDFVFRITQPPFYYEFAGISKNENDFIKSLGLDLKVIDQLRADSGANLIRSDITFKDRRIIWRQGPLGGLYVTLDVEQVTADRSFIRRPITDGGFTANFDASEVMFIRLNGMIGGSLYDKNGKRQDAVPDKIAKDTSDPHGDGRVVPLISCIRCHVEDGLRPFQDDQTKLVGNGRIGLYSYDPKLVQRAAEFYQEPRLQRQMKFDRETYAAACSQATLGLTPSQASEALGRVVRKFGYLSVTPAQAARELAIDPELLGPLMQASRDPILLTLAEGRSVLRNQWNSSYAEAALTTEANRVRMIQ